MIDLTELGRNNHELQLGEYRILFSYRTPVAFHDIHDYYITDKALSRTSSRHISSWLRGSRCFTLKHRALVAKIQGIIKEDGDD